MILNICSINTSTCINYVVLLFKIVIVYKNDFTHRKKRAKQREEYLQKREEILSNKPSEEIKARAQAR